MLRRLVFFTMNGENGTPELKFVPSPMGRREVFFEVIRGIGVVAGLGLFWVLEIVRDVYFGILDRLGFKARRKTHASAFPPGSPKTHRAA